MANRINLGSSNPEIPVMGPNGLEVNVRLVRDGDPTNLAGGEGVVKGEVLIKDKGLTFVDKNRVYVFKET